MTEPAFFLPRECPECDRIISPATQPKVGDLCVCPRCQTPLIFIEDLMLRRANIRDQLGAKGPAQKEV